MLPPTGGARSDLHQDEESGRAEPTQNTVAKPLERIMSAKKVDRRLAVKGDAICFDFLKSDPAVYFDYLAAPGNLSEMFREPSSVIRGIKGAVNRVSQPPIKDAR
jgi:hypothetical protein